MSRHQNQLIDAIEEESFANVKRPDISIGDTIRVHTRIIEGKRERIQVFAGTVIAKKGRGLSETITVYRTAFGCNMERVFIIYSPRIANIEVVRGGKVRRAKLNYIRGKSGKGAKIAEKITQKATKEKKAPKPKVVETKVEEPKEEKSAE